MNTQIETSPCCIALTIIALAIVVFLLVHPLNCASSAGGSISSVLALVVSR